VGMSEFTSSVVCIWLVSWAFRRKYETDSPLDGTGQFLRWSFVVGGLSTGFLRGGNLGGLRVAGLVVGMAFLCWPNLAFHMVEILHKVRRRTLN
jgi:hypothetical protein